MVKTRINSETEETRNENGRTLQSIGRTQKRRFSRRGRNGEQTTVVVETNETVITVIENCNKQNANELVENACAE